MRIEAAAFAGRPTSLRFFPSYEPLVPPASPSSGDGVGVAVVAALILIVAVVLLLLTAIFGGLYVAQRNLRSGRGDARGARRLGFGVAVALGVSWFLGPFTFSLNAINGFLGMLVFVGAVGGITWALYLAVEPFMRRHAPEALIGWTRFIDGRFADPLVGRDILVGCAVGALSRLLDVVPMMLGERGATVRNFVGLPLESLRELFGTITGAATVYIILALGLSFLFGLTFVVLRRRWWAAYAVWLFFLGGIGFIPGTQVGNVRPAETLLTSVFWVISWALWLFVLLRPGILVFVAMGTTSSLLTIALPTLNASAWYSWSMVAGFTILIGVAGYAFYRSARWKGGLAEALVGD